MSLTPALEAQGLTVMLGGLPILRDVSLRVDAGEAVALMGGNGSGKSTLVRALLGVLPRSSGTVALFGTPLERFRDWASVGYVPQKGAPTLRQATVAEVASVGRLAHRRPFSPPRRRDRVLVAEALDQVGMTDRSGDAFSDLSGGQQQRVLIARALAAEAKLLILDEPFAGVDVRTQEQLARLIGGLVEGGLAALIVLHELGPFEGRLARSIVLREGRVISSDTVAPGHHVHHGHEVDPPDRARMLSGLGHEEG